MTRTIRMRSNFEIIFILIYNSYFRILFEKTFQQMGRVAISGEDVVVVSSNFSPMASLSSI